MCTVDYLEAAKRNLEYTTPELVTSPDLARQYLDNASMMNRTNPRRKALRRLQTRLVSKLISKADCILYCIKQL